MQLKKQLVSIIFLLLILSNQATAKNLQVPDFTEIAKEGTPAVVSVKVTQQSAKSQHPMQKSPFDFQDEFFQRFFGTPRNDRFFQQPEPAIGQASGFLVSSDGYILTNNHVVESAGEVFVTLNNGREYAATIIGRDPHTDIAVLKIDADHLPFLNLGNSDALEVGEWVVAIGNPLGLQASVTKGIVSAKGRNNLNLTTFEDYIQTDAAINRGNSGGPLIDMEGNVIGINSAIVTSMGTGGYMGIGFAIPSNMAHHVMDQLINGGSVTRGFLGIALQKVDSDLADAFNLENVSGALVAEVTPNSPAKKAGIKQGDIILSYDDHPVHNIASLRNAVSMMTPGARITLQILRNGKMIEIPITVGTFPTAEAKISSTSTKLGFEVETLTPELARKLNIENVKGVVITKVEPGSPAAWAGIAKGTLITAVNRKPVASAEEFSQALQETLDGKPVLLLIKQGESTRFVSIKVN